MQKLYNATGLLEAPRVDSRGRVLFSNVTEGGVYRWADGSVQTVLSARRGIGGIAVHADGGLVVTGRDVCYVHAGVEQTLLTLDGATGFNDVTVGPDGVVYVGVLRHRPMRGEPVVPSEVVRIGLDGSVADVVTGVHWPNGLGFAPDGQTLYVCEYAESRVLAVRDGRTSVFATAAIGECDGLAVDADGGVWVALGSGGAIARFAPTGQLLDTIELPGTFVSSLAFSGTVLYITTNSGLFTTVVDTTGSAVPPARIPH
ncbi:SMP-30/gluconolactonase/LRE family protein [Nocardia sp. bgisy118]|uniref:SMP-30/gluconolactonase/LRE family protein n=1 Tax=Nocardia sp. bgisy118 TaxID=3413786 RepID=UPI003F49F954